MQYPFISVTQQQEITVDWIRCQHHNSISFHFLPRITIGCIDLLQNEADMVVHMAEKRRGRPKDPTSGRSRGEDRHKGEGRIVVILKPFQEVAIDSFLGTIRPATTRSAMVRDALVEYMQKRGSDFPLTEPPEPPGAG
jgi:hypothetical protein